MSISNETPAQNSNPNPDEELTLFSLPEQPSRAEQTTTPLEQPVEKFDNTTLQQAVDQKVLNPLPDTPEQLTETPKSNRNKWIAGAIAATLLVGGGLAALLRGGEGDDKDHATTPVAASTHTPGVTTSPSASATETTTPSATATQTPSPTETVVKPRESYVPNTPIEVFTSKINPTRVAALKAQYPDLEKYMQLPARTALIATPADIKRQQALVKSVYSDPNMSPFLVGDDPALKPWFTSDDIANGSDVDSTAGNPIVAFPDFAYEWAFFFWNSDQPTTITSETDKMIRMADMSEDDAKSYEAKVAPEGKQIGHAKAVHSDIVGAVQKPDGRIFVNTVTEYEPGNNEPTGRVSERWSVIAPAHGVIKGAPANTDMSFNLGEEYLGQATN